MFNKARLLPAKPLVRSGFVMTHGLMIHVLHPLRKRTLDVVPYEKATRRCRVTTEPKQKRADTAARGEIFLAFPNLLERTACCPIKSITETKCEQLWLFFIIMHSVTREKRESQCTKSGCHTFLLFPFISKKHNRNRKKEAKNLSTGKKTLRNGAIVIIM